MIYEMVGLVFMVLIIIFIVNTIENVRAKRRNSISFKEAMDLVEIPVVTFYNGDKKLNFLLDTGSNNSIINESAISDLKYEECNSKVSTIGMEGNKSESNVCIIKLNYKNNTFKDEFSVINMDSAFSTIKQESGVQIHGILGSKFFEKYKYVLDFKELIAYIK